MPAESSFGKQLESKTDTYLSGLTDCIELLPGMLEQYAASGAYEETLDRIQSLESDCDEQNRAISGAITNADAQDIGLLNTRIQFNASALLELYKTLDVIANHTERIAQELVMMQPSSEPDCYDGLQEMATHTVTMAETLEEVVNRFVHDLCYPDSSDTLTEEIQTVRALESECDELRNDVIATAFSDPQVDQPLVYREFAILLDELANEMEDLTDRIVIIATDEPGITTEPDPTEE